MGKQHDLHWRQGEQILHQEAELLHHGHLEGNNKLRLQPTGTAYASTYKRKGKIAWLQNKSTITGMAPISTWIERIS